MFFSDLAVYFKKLEDTPSRNTMTEILAQVFSEASPNEISRMCYLLQGRVGPAYDAIEFGIADKFMIRAIAQAYGASEKEVITSFKKLGDLGLAAESCYHVLLHDNKHETISLIYDRMYALAMCTGQGSQEKKISLLADMLCSVNALSARYIARIPLDKLRLGFSDMTMLDSLSWMLSKDKSHREELERAYNVYPDIGYIAQQIKEYGIKGLSRVKAKVGAPILAALCQRIPTADAMIKKMGVVAVEPKYDGVRVQIHYKKGSIHTYSRNLENTTAMFPELARIGSELDADEVILDSEAVGMDIKTGKLIPFQETMTRKRKHDIGVAQSNVPLRFFVFDILYKNGQDLLSTPLSKRRLLLEKTLKHQKILALSPQIVTDSAQTLRQYHDEQLKKGLEGAVVKKWESPYEPGRRNYSWVKFKEEEGKTGKLTDTIDAVIMGYSRGEGKRSGFGIGMFLVGVRQGDSYVTVTKIGTGVSDELWKEFHTKLHDIKVSRQPKEYVNVNKMFTPDVWVAPKIVVEIAGDDLTRSSTHGAGVAVRFPRLVGIRTDKSSQEATTVQEVRTMFDNQKQSGI